MIAGDLNTLETRLTRLTGFSKAARATHKPWYISECKWWKQHVLPPTGYVDPWSCKEWTHTALAVYREKLDWILIKNCPVLRYGRGNFNTSDHRPLWVDLALK